VPDIGGVSIHEFLQIFNHLELQMSLQPRMESAFADSRGAAELHPKMESIAHRTADDMLSSLLYIQNGPR
jgi:hypothetical protein